MSKCDTKVETKICYLNAYRLVRTHGGPEEGGWYYHSHEFLAAVPFKANVTYRVDAHDGSDPNNHYYQVICKLGMQCWEEDGEILYWRPSEIEALDKEWEEAEHDRLLELFGDADAVIVVAEIVPNERSLWDPERYC